jgi:hypothetical protein
MNCTTRIRIEHLVLINKLRLRKIEVQDKYSLQLN